jgi:hypothetical protein
MIRPGDRAGAAFRNFLGKVPVSDSTLSSPYSERSFVKIAPTHDPLWKLRMTSQGRESPVGKNGDGNIPG